MMILVNVSVATKPATIEQAVVRALKHKLYQNEAWMFYELFQVPSSILKMATAFFNRKPIGVSVYWDYELLPEYQRQGYQKQLGCYVKEDFRRHQVGSQLIQRIRAPKSAVVGQGLAVSREFWGNIRPEAEFQ